MKQPLTQKRLKKLLHYNPNTGNFIWLINRGNQKSGFVAGGINQRGYCYISVDKKQYRANRLAWLYVYGYFPENGIDHIDRIKHHNWIKNLREVSTTCNIRNTGNYKTNTSGVKGIYWSVTRSKWVAEIKVNNKLSNLGGYVSFCDAVCARLSGEQCLDWQGCDSSSPAFKYVQRMLGEN